MTCFDFDVVVVGTGASGVSAAFPLADAGLRILMIDPDDGKTAPALPALDYMDARRASDEQWRWMFGNAQAASDQDETSSPKFRVPTLARIFENYGAAVRLDSLDFTPVGSLTSGGLTAAWGAGVAAFSEADLAAFPISADDLAPHYRKIARRIGLSGGDSDALSGHFNLDGLTGPPTSATPLAAYIEARYEARAAMLRSAGFAMGRARLAVLSSDRDGRQACAGSGLCLWGCPRRSIYSASFDLAALKLRSNVTHASGILVQDLSPAEEGWEVRGIHRSSGAPYLVRTRAVVLAAGVIGTTRLAMQVSGIRGRATRLLSTPTAAFALFVPALFGSGQRQGTGLAQHWYVLREGDDEVCGGLFPTLGLPVAEFVSRAPLTKRAGLDIMRWMLPATTVGNLFFHAKHSAHTITLRDDDRLILQGGFSSDFEHHLARSAKRMRAVFRRLGAFALPGSFSAGAPGSDVHYAGTLPMRSTPGPLETDADGRLFGHDGLYVADASALSDLPAKSHTFTVMANAARIGERLARRFPSNPVQRAGG